MNLDQSDAVDVGVTWFFDLLVQHGIDSGRWHWADDEGPLNEDGEDIVDLIIAALEHGFTVEARLYQGMLIFTRHDRLGSTHLGFIFQHNAPL